MRILLVEDDKMLGAALKRALEQAAYTVDWARAGDEALAATRAQAYDAIILDLTLPRIDGLEALRQLRREQNGTPVLIMSARDEQKHKIEGLDAGADDYLAKPFDLDELLARLRARVRREDRRTSDVITIGAVALHIVNRQLTLNGDPVPMTAKELKLLTLLMRRAGRFVSKAEIEASLYDTEAEIDSNTIETAVYGVRRKLGSGFIVTGRGLGYQVPR